MRTGRRIWEIITAFEELYSLAEALHECGQSGPAKVCEQHLLQTVAESPLVDESIEDSFRYLVRAKAFVLDGEIVNKGDRFGLAKSLANSFNDYEDKLLSL